MPCYWRDGRCHAPILTPGPCLRVENAAKSAKSVGEIA
jgi:hypothetical protein